MEPILIPLSCHDVPQFVPQSVPVRPIPDCPVTDPMAWSRGATVAELREEIALLEEKRLEALGRGERAVARVLDWRMGVLRGEIARRVA